MSEPLETGRLFSLTVDIVTAHIEHGDVVPDATPDLIRQTYRTLRALANGESAEKESAPERPLEPAVPIKKSVQPDYIVCLEDGKKLKMLKRYLRATYNLTPEQYRERWGLPASYPMTAPNYSQFRRERAKEVGLGHHRRAAE